MTYRIDQRVRVQLTPKTVKTVVIYHIDGDDFAFVLPGDDDYTWMPLTAIIEEDDE